MIKKFVKALLLLVLLAFLVLLGLYIIPPTQEIIEYDNSEIEKDTSIDSKVGWYLADNGKEYQITWGAKKGLQLNHFDSLRSNLKNIRLTQLGPDQFDTNGDLETSEVRFEINSIDSTLTLSVATSKTNFNAFKKDSLHYKQEEIEYISQGLKMSGLLMTPNSNQKSIGIIFIHGSGVSDRDNFWYMYQADYLARNGFTVLLPDKRGCGKSEGEWHTSSFDDFAHDIVAAHGYLLNDASSEFSKIGVLGISQGGWISHLVNTKLDDLDFVIDVVGSATSPKEQVRFEILNEIQNSGAPAFLAKPLSIVFAKRAMGKRKIWWEKNGDFDPIPLMQESKVSILKVFAEDDENVPVEKSLALIDTMLKNNPDCPLTVKMFTGLGHALIDSDSEWIRNDYLDYVIEWVSFL